MKQQAVDKTPKFSLRDFIKQTYKTDAESPVTLKATIRDIGILPFEIDLYGSAIILVEPTGKMRNGFDGTPEPERIYRGKFDTMSCCLNWIVQLLAARSIMNEDTTIITISQYHQAFFKTQTYFAKMVQPELERALRKFTETFPLKSLESDDGI